MAGRPSSLRFDEDEEARDLKQMCLELSSAPPILDAVVANALVSGVPLRWFQWDFGRFS